MGDDQGLQKKEMMLIEMIVAILNGQYKRPMLLINSGVFMYDVSLDTSEINSFHSVFYCVFFLWVFLSLLFWLQAKVFWIL